MNRLAHSRSMLGYIAAETRNEDDKKALEMVRHLHQRLEQHGLTLEDVVLDAVDPARHLAKMPKSVLNKTTWRAWAGFLLARRSTLPEKDARHLRYCTGKRSHLNTNEMRWIFDIVHRVEPAGCGTWGAPV